MEARLTEISRREALRYLGVRGTPDEALIRDLDRCAKRLLSAARPRVCWRIFSLEKDAQLSTAQSPDKDGVIKPGSDLHGRRRNVLIQNAYHAHLFHRNNLKQHGFFLR